MKVTVLFLIRTLHWVVYPTLCS